MGTPITPSLKTSKRKKMPKKMNSISELEARMDPEVLARAKKMAQEESLNVRLAILREKYGVKQNELTAFTQTAVSKLENRRDIRISTLIDYLNSLGMDLEIIACPRTPARRNCCCGYERVKTIAADYSESGINLRLTNVR
jgi:transcriptional regulator with XRE-family HTH domain